MSASEFAFLALGLVLGLACGAAVVEVLRARPPAAREVRVTVARNSIHARRASTLSEDAFETAEPGPARGGPADRRWVDRDLPPSNAPSFVEPSSAAPADDVARRVEAPSSGTPVRSGPTTRSSAVALAEPSPFRLAPASRSGGAMVAVPMSLEPDPLTAALRATAAAVATAAMGPAGRRAARSAEPIARSQPVAGRRQPPAAGPEAAGEPASGATAPSADGGPCAEERRVADERCTVADRAREQNPVLGF